LIFILLHIIAVTEGAGWRVTPELFTPLDMRSVAISDDGRVFVLDRREATIYSYGADGAPLPEVGGKGQGPGELQRPFIIEAHGDRLYVYEYGLVHVFDLDGSFLEKLHTRAHGGIPRKVAGGWVGIVKDGDAEGQTDTARQMVLYDASFENGKVLMTWVSQNENAFPGERKFLVNPAPELALDDISDYGSRIFFRKPGEASFHVIDAVEGVVLREVAVPFTRMPFDLDWGKRRVAVHEERFAKRGIEVIAEYPESFPSISSMTWLREGCLRIGRKTGGEDDNSQFLYFDAEGDPVEPTFGDHADQLIAIRGEMAYVHFFDEAEEEPVLICHPVSSLERLFRERDAKP